MPTTRPVASSTKKLSRWRSPMPSTWPAMVSAARDRAKAERTASIASAPTLSESSPRASKSEGTAACARSSMSTASLDGIASQRGSPLAGFKLSSRNRASAWSRADAGVRARPARPAGPAARAPARSALRISPSSVLVPSTHSISPTRSLSGSTAYVRIASPRAAHCPSAASTELTTRNSCCTRWSCRSAARARRCRAPSAAWACAATPSLEARRQTSAPPPAPDATGRRRHRRPRAAPARPGSLRAPHPPRDRRPGRERKSTTAPSPPRAPAPTSSPTGATGLTARSPRGPAPPPPRPRTREASPQCDRTARPSCRGTSWQSRRGAGRARPHASTRCRRRRLPPPCRPCPPEAIRGLDPSRP
eukprot:scaffold17682_cov113-Isochrysis_galbana.AAC.11